MFRSLREWILESRIGLDVGQRQRPQISSFRVVKMARPFDTRFSIKNNSFFLVLHYRNLIYVYLIIGIDFCLNTFEEQKLLPQNSPQTACRHLDNFCNNIVRLTKLEIRL